ncbi:hypothetical protein BDV95DRAFT_606893 [Massariosphaeria phaeospora]|uniref:Uncharacterized protein n=1 Tax=Massariosphaeria phaeospora TaxID=100035 RepID=A0A7C8I9D0_9PLEO|nr:hypothetical protein BDV95DRAFT_606893 [Massariosphaeria phaeospora]
MSSNDQQHSTPPTWSSPEIQQAFHNYWQTPEYRKAANQQNFFDDWTMSELQWTYNPPEPWYSIFYECPMMGLEEFNDGIIHSIFRRSNWITDLPKMDMAYEAMRPALRVATEFLMHDEFMDWWVHVRFAELTDYSRKTYLENRSKKAGPEAKQQVKEELQAFADKVRFTWSTPAPPQGALAFHCPTIPILAWHIGDRKLAEGYANRYHQNPYIRSTIFLDMGWYHRILADGPTVNQNLRCQMHLATTLLHELGHAWYSQWQTERVEPFAYVSDLVPEMGFSLEIALFGALLEGADARMTSLLPLVSKRIEDRWPVPVDIFTLVPMTWVQQWFQKRTWQDIPTLRANGALRLANTNDRTASVLRVIFDSQVGTLLRKWDFESYAQDSQENSASGLSVAERYKNEWFRDAKKAFQVNALPDRYYKPTEFAQHFRSYVPPPWALTANKTDEDLPQFSIRDKN